VVWVVLQLRWTWERRCRGERIGWEDGLVEDLAIDPCLDVLDVRRCWEVDWVAVRVNPGVGGSAEQIVSSCKYGYDSDVGVLTVLLTWSGSSARCTLSARCCGLRSRKRT